MAGTRVTATKALNALCALVLTLYVIGGVGVLAFIAFN
jgi:hypothetical protein